MVSFTTPRVAVLHQANDSPVVDEFLKPENVWGYKDSSADIAAALRARGVNVVTFASTVVDSSDDGWSFGDTYSEISRALDKGANLIWANATLHTKHAVAVLPAGVSFVGHDPLAYEFMENKLWVGTKLRQLGLKIPTAYHAREINGRLEYVSSCDMATTAIWPLGYPAVAKPVRGRGSWGVKVLHSAKETSDFLSQAVSIPSRRGISMARIAVGYMIEEYMPGIEITISVMPPSVKRPLTVTQDPRVHVSHSGYWCLPPLVRNCHIEGVLPYSRDVPAVFNTGTIVEVDAGVRKCMERCVHTAEFFKFRSLVRFDCRQDICGDFRVLDLNMKPNLAGPGRVGRDKAGGLVFLGATAIGWDFGDLVLSLLETAHR